MSRAGPFPEAHIAALATLLGSVGCHGGYVLKSAAFQAELLASREPIPHALERGGLDAERARKLALVPRIKAFGEGLGLSSLQSYRSVASRWDRTLYNLSACPPLSLEPHTWWFPVVGRVPYLGFFRERDLARWQRRLEADGYEVWTRPVGAYSTLGWFRDPVLPGMLDWPEHRLAEVILHETAHATLWVPGEVSFNETYAVVVGEEASRRWMVAEHGAGSEAVLAMERERRDAVLWRTLTEEMYQDLDRLYKDENISPEQKREAKVVRFGRMIEDVQRGRFSDPDRAQRALREEVWNNARLVQAHTYDDRRALLDALLAQHGGELRSFTEDLSQRLASRRDPWEALGAASGPTSESHDAGFKSSFPEGDRPDAPGHDGRSEDRDTGPRSGCRTLRPSRAGMEAKP